MKAKLHYTAVSRDHTPITENSDIEHMNSEFYGTQFVLYCIKIYKICVSRCVL